MLASSVELHKGAGKSTTKILRAGKSTTKILNMRPNCKMIHD
jgi:hypothetical protein